MSSRCRPRGFCARVGEWPGRAVTRGEVMGPGGDPLPGSVVWRSHAPEQLLA